MARAESACAMQDVVIPLEPCMFLKDKRPSPQWTSVLPQAVREFVFSCGRRAWGSAVYSVTTHTLRLQLVHSKLTLWIRERSTLGVDMCVEVTVFDPETPRRYIPPSRLLKIRDAWQVDRTAPRTMARSSVYWQPDRHIPLASSALPSFVW
jgi:hypothetical protein